MTGQDLLPSSPKITLILVKYNPRRLTRGKLIMMNNRIPAYSQTSNSDRAEVERLGRLINQAGRLIARSLNITENQLRDFYGADIDRGAILFYQNIFRHIHAMSDSECAAISLILKEGKHYDAVARKLFCGKGTASTIANCKSLFAAGETQACMIIYSLISYVRSRASRSDVETQISLLEVFESEKSKPDYIALTILQRLQISLLAFEELIRLQYVESVTPVVLGLHGVTVTKRQSNIDSVAFRAITKMTVDLDSIRAGYFHTYNSTSRLSHNNDGDREKDTLVRVNLEIQPTDSVINEKTSSQLLGFFMLDLFCGSYSPLYEFYRQKPGNYNPSVGFYEVRYSIFPANLDRYTQDAILQLIVKMCDQDVSSRILLQEAYRQFCEIMKKSVIEISYNIQQSIKSMVAVKDQYPAINGRYESFMDQMRASCQQADTSSPALPGASMQSAAAAAAASSSPNRGNAADDPAGSPESAISASIIAAAAGTDESGRQSCTLSQSNDQLARFGMFNPSSASSQSPADDKTDVRGCEQDKSAAHFGHGRQ